MSRGSEFQTVSNVSESVKAMSLAFVLWDFEHPGSILVSLVLFCKPRLKE